MKMYSIFEIANWFLEKEPMTHKKMQKLCYYAQAWFLVLQDKAPLFGEKFEAWAHGPVNRELWEKYKEYGYTEIPQKTSGEAKITDKKTEDVLNSVWDTYGEMTGFQLEDMTHEERPWAEARGTIPYYAPSTAVIKENTMYAYYKSVRQEAAEM